MSQEYGLFLRIKKIFSERPGLFHEIFNESMICLKNDPEKVLRMFNHRSHRDQILIRVALDLWNGKGGTQLIDIVHHLDERDFNNVFIAINKARSDRVAIDFNEDLELLF